MTTTAVMMKKVSMTDLFFKHPILNSPYDLRKWVSKVPARRARAYPCSHKLLMIPMIKIGNQINMPMPPAMRHHHTFPIPLTSPFVCMIKFLAFMANIKEHKEPIPANQRIENTIPHFNIESTFLCSPSVFSTIINPLSPSYRAVSANLFASPQSPFGF